MTREALLQVQLALLCLGEARADQLPRLTGLSPRECRRALRSLGRRGVAEERRGHVWRLKAPAPAAGREVSGGVSAGAGERDRTGNQPRGQ